MTAIFDLALWTRILTITVIDLMLAGDNALVVALAVRTLPRRQQLLGRLWGTAGAIILRLIFVACVSLLLEVPLLRFAGGVALIWIAVKLIRQDAGEEATARHGASLKEAIWIIIAADVSMSLDNVIAIAGAAHGELGLVAFGICLSMPIVVWGSGVLARLMNRYTWIIWLGGGILGKVAGEMIVADEMIAGSLGKTVHAVGVALPVGLAVALVVLGWASSRFQRPHADESVREASSVPASPPGHP
jgi:YjbE family integral membrane protein